MIRCVAFDFDGTLADSNRLKHDAWFDVFGRVGAGRGETEALLAALPTADRFELIAVMLKRLTAQGRVTPRTDLAAELAQAYNDLCEHGQATCPEMPGAVELLKTLHPRMPLYVNSATPEEPLRRIVARRGWSPFFRGVFGRPRSKADILHDILAREHLDPTALALVGDGQADWQGAQQVGCPFFAVGELTATPYGVRVNQLSDLAAVLSHPVSV